VYYGLGRLVVPFLTAGLVRTAEVRDKELTFAWYGLARGRDGRAVLSDAFTIFVGLAMFLLLLPPSSGFSMRPDNRAPNKPLERPGVNTCANAAAASAGRSAPSR
jgi:hypothetical protein